MISSFYIQLYKIVDDPSSDQIISWSKSSPNIFVVWDLKKLRRDILFKSSGVLGRNLSEFIAKLRSHGFRSVLKGFGELEFEHDDFTRGLVTKKTKIIKAFSDRFDAQIKAIKCRFKAKKASSSLKVEHLFP
ncbi:hypothetical protein IGI04_015545 [Brassica rapa subsp. trilocularis]|uniref:HSF-type DNA-binding domain-containing protein n=3 Tax=Brassica TaxID=3705 RepID=M4EA04_BRACM|nr:heat stress transcription factor A-4a [Brassica rapa]KAG5400938.1 hypothetical protein IGI04_015545 [Brassica rapa subsp. trilocularis]CAF2273446.1 unnamed protein product [Brassica napus]CDY44601.1 BnaA04g09890D [Brassica napus]